ncbi:branched-chain amino acid transport system II carrier protein [Piscibacillus halophilus]|uniref:Branched-chain amino acid transport system carrier protein n=1 Tax=Piscibacillus halophilus TaxID=571933 RepID=A0A1H9DJ91_9BACI|nr:branched-chain amino acid transport system II carrier protein [Piscibacillus halophilus]SEQ13545.1 branched-chain amino acid:cation transporter, LIVCS family [Piscibacillus halophilus]
MATRTTSILAVGFMLFALFFGAGNLIFPAMLGQMAGDNLVPANIGFIITGVGLPVLGIIALAYSGKDNLQSLASRVHPLYGITFASVLYLTIGPLFAIPRTNTVAYEIGINPFINNNVDTIPLLIFSIIFFGITLYFSLQSQKLVDVVGKMLSPLLLVLISVLVVTAIVNPIGTIQPPTEDFLSGSFFKGFQEGYLTMDMLAAFVFGIIVINILKERGSTSKRDLIVNGLKVALIAGILLAIIYSSLAYLGATSVEGIGHLDNGGAVLANSFDYYFGTVGSILLAFIVIAACLTTSIGLITACASYFKEIVPSVSYKQWAVLFTVVSAVLANFGLNKIIEFSIPVLSLLYPLAICLLVLTFLHPLFKGRTAVYQFSILFTFIVSLIERLYELGVPVDGLHEFFTAVLPWYGVGLGWIVPAIIGGLIGYIISSFNSQPKISV